MLAYYYQYYFGRLLHYSLRVLLAFITYFAMTYCAYVEYI